MLRETIDLCGLWRFQPDLGGEGDSVGYFDPGYDHTLWREVRLPACFEACGPGLDTYEGIGWFRRTVDVPEAWAGKRIALCFQGVNYHARVWVNGQVAGENQDGFLPFEWAVQGLLRPGEKNLVTVQVDNFRRQGQVPGLQRGWRTFGGILREVELLATDTLYLAHVAALAEPADKGGRLSVRAMVENGRGQAVQATLRVRVLDGTGTTLADLSSRPTALDQGSEGSLAVQGGVLGVIPWSPDRPTLYTARVELGADGWLADEQTVRLGFRTIAARDGKLLLNGQPIYLTGFNRHEDSPRRDMAADLETARQDLGEIKKAGANFVRLCHYPHHPAELDLCDELGLLAMGEIPLYWWDGLREGEEHCAQKLSVARRQLSRMIARDINHPSVIFWSVSNETDERRPEVVDGNRELVELARRLDPTRLAVHVSDHWQQNAHFDHDDVLCVNAYPSLDRRGYGGQHAYDWAESTRYWRRQLQGLHDQYPQKPILITEFGAISLEKVYGNAFGEDVQAQAIENEFAGMDAPYVCGATIWCWADHAWPPAFFEFCRHLAVSPYGVVSRERRKLKAYWTARRLFTERQGAAQIPGPPSPWIGPAGREVFMIRSHLSSIPQVSFPEGFGIRPMRLGEGTLWTDIERDAEEYFEISNDVFLQQFGYDLQATQWRSFIITNPKGAGVGTISAWYDRSFKGQDYGQIHWVAIRPAYQRKGLGKAAVSIALNQLAQWHERCYLGTQTKRLPAIKLYLDFGFVPDLDQPGAAEAWSEVKRLLKHPALDRI